LDLKEDFEYFETNESKEIFEGGDEEGRGLKYLGGIK